MKFLDWLDDLPIAYKAVLIGVPFVVQVALVGAVWKSHLEILDAQKESTHASLALESGERAYAWVTRWHNSMLLYAFEPNAQNLQRMQSFGEIAETRMEALPPLFTDENPSQDLLGGLRREFSDLKAIADKVTSLLKAGFQDQALDVFRQFKVGREIKDIRSELDAFLNFEESRRGVYARELQSASTSMLFLLSAGSLISFLSLGLASWALGISVMKRLRTLGRNVDEISNGRPPSERVPGRDELGRLDKALHSLSHSLRENALENELFVYSVSHDLRSPLVNLEGFSKELKVLFASLENWKEEAFVPNSDDSERVRRILLHEAPQSLHFIGAAVERISGIINALLRLSRAGRVEYQLKPVDLNAVVAKVIAAERHLLDGKDIQVSVGLLPEVMTDPAAIEQVLGNLVSNAIRYSDPAKSKRHLSIQVAGEPPRQGSVAISVSDNGLGIPLDAQTKLFLAFQRFHPEVSGGEGIGLALARRILSRLGGRIRVESVPGEGACFFVELPTSRSIALASESITV